MFFWILWGIDAVVSLVILYFLLIGLGDGSVSSANGGLWAIIILAIAAIMGGSLLLRAHHHMALAKLLLCVMAVPGVLYGLFLLLVITTNPRWN